MATRMIESFSIIDAIRTCGAREYLACIRNRFRRGNYTRDHFYYLAARAYLAIGKPLRAQALLGRLPPHYAPRNGLPAAALLIDEAVNSEGSPFPSCSLNMIVRNESANVGAALDSVDEIMDEIVVCDTGSGDNTADIVERYGARIIHEPWQNDFSAARNSAIGASTRDWIFWMDADDRLVNESKKELIRQWQQGEPRCVLVRIESQKKGPAGSAFLQARLFPRIDGMRFEQRIHEQIMYSAKRLGIPFATCDSVHIIHTGYDNPAGNITKAMRNRALLEEELKANPASPVLHMSLGDALYIIGEYEQACIKYLHVLSMENAYNLNPDVYVQAAFYCALACYRLGNITQTRRFLYRCLYLDSTRIEAWYLLGILAQKEGDNRRALKWFEKCLHIEPPTRITTADNTTTKAQAARHIARHMLDNNDYRRARDFVTSLLPRFRGVPVFHLLLGQAFLGTGALVDAARSFTCAIAMAPEHSGDAYKGLAAIYDRLGDSRQAEEFRSRAESTGQRLSNDSTRGNQRHEQAVESPGILQAA